MYAQRIRRCLKLCTLLQTCVGYSAQELAQEAGVSKRTVYRDLRALQDAGIMVRFDEKRSGYVIPHRFAHRPPELTDDELLMLLLAASTSPLNESFKLRQTIGSSIRKLISRVPTRLQEEATNLLRCVTAESNCDPLPLHRETVCGKILQGIQQQLHVRITYIESNLPSTRQARLGAALQTKLAPYRMIMSPDGWRVTGRSTWHREVRIFELNCISSAELTEDSFEFPPKYRRREPSPELPTQLSAMVVREIAAGS